MTLRHSETGCERLAPSRVFALYEGCRAHAVGRVLRPLSAHIDTLQAAAAAARRRD
jgi:hypothetical protein